MKVLILDDHQAIRELTKQYVLEILPTVEFVEASNIQEAKAALDEHMKFDYAICDLELKAGCSTEFPELCQHNRIPFMVYSSHVNLDLINVLEKLRVKAYVSKTSGVACLRKGLEALFKGHRYYCPLVAGTKESKEEYKEVTRLHLTPGQKKIMQVLSKGFNREEATGMLNIKRTTLNNQVARARESNDCESFEELLRRYRFWDH